MTLDESQRELLRSAVEQGYFDVPRRTTLVALSEQHDLSDVETSEQLRSGIDAVLREYLSDGPVSAD